MYSWPDGIEYDGSWLENKKHGYGRLKWLDGSREYAGEFRNDERHGKGTYTWEFGTKSYRGFWRNGVKDGVGYVRDEFDFVEKKGLWYCGKLVKWLPHDKEDEGQEGSSIVSQDQRDWDNDAGKESQNQMQEQDDQFIDEGLEKPDS